MVKVLQTSNRNITNEKNKYLTIYESLPNPVIIFDLNNQIESMNHAAMTLLGETSVPGRCYYNKQKIMDLSWLTEALTDFTANYHEQTSLEKQVVIKETTCFLELNFNTLFDISGKYNGTVVIINDITEIRQVEEELRNRFKQQKIISDISTKLINLAPNEVSKTINDALMKIGRFAGADRSYIFIFSDDRTTIDNTHEWCNQGVTPQIDNLKGLHVSTFPWLIKKLARFEIVNIPVVDDLPPQARLEKESFQAQDIKSLTLVPLNYAGELAGLVGFDSVFKERTWPEETIAPLKIVGEMLINVIQRNKSDQEAQSAYKELDQIFTTAGDGMRVIDVNFNVMRVNDAFCALTGVSKEESVGKKCYDLFYDSHCNTQDCPLFRITGGEERVEYDVLKECNSGVKIPCILTATPLRTPGGQIIGIVENFKDITERKLAEEALKKNEERFRLLAENACDIIYRARIHPVPKFEYISPAVGRMTGYEPEEFYADPYLNKKILHPDDRGIWKKVVDGNSEYAKPITVRWLPKDGGIIWVEHCNVPVYDGRGRLVALEGIARNVTDRMLMEEQLRYLSFHDPLTGLYNRAYFGQEMQRLEDRRYHPVGIIICDVDELKLVNDNLGHCAGDQTLITAANVLKQSFRKSDVVARIGGDEFAVLMPNSDLNTVEKACRRITKEVNNYPTGSAFKFSMSVGFAVSNEQTTSLNEIYKEADNNMYRKKLHHKNCN